MGGGQEHFRGRLARLRRDGGAAEPGSGGSNSSRADSARDGQEPNAPERAGHSGARSGGGMPLWLRAKLARKQERAQAGAGFSGSGSSGSGSAGALAEAAARWERTTGDPGGLTEERTARGTFVARTQVVPVDGTVHGAWRLDEARHADPAAFARLANDPALAGLDTGQAVYLDTETSGLGGGAGVYVYMVGLGWFDGDGHWVSWQGFLRDPGEEPALLQAAADRVAAAPALVSFFGKSFDRHRLEDKMRIAGVTPPFAGRPHLDLYHPLRRLTRGAFADGRLQTMERELLGFHRERDLPGALAPAAWFDYLAGRPHLLEGVFLHNHEDVLSLGVLAGYLGRALVEERACGAPLPGPAARRAVALAESTKDRAEARLWAERALERGAEGEDRRRMQLLAAESARLVGDADAARILYREALEECADDRTAVRLFRGAAMLLERSLGDADNALTMAQRGLKVARELRCPPSEVGDLERRVERLR